MSDWSDYSREVQAAADASWRKQESIIKDLKHCIKELTKERDEWQSLAEAAIKDDAAKNVYYAEMNAKLAKAVEALKFYANADNYEDQHKPESCGCCYYLHDAEIKEDEGVKARATLAALKGEKYD